MTGPNKRTAVICLCLFALAFFVRIIVWQNNKSAIDGVQYVVTEVYKKDARLLVNGDARGFLTGPDPPSDATIIMHPPGYPVFIAAVYALFGENESLRIIQILLNSLAAVFVFFLTRQLFEETTAIVTGVLTALSPQFAYHSAIILPDELSALPIILAIYFLVRAWREKRIVFVAFCGLSLGLSCWLRSNGLVLAFFLAAAVMIVFPRDWRFKAAAVMLAAFVLAIAPITIRNGIVFRSFIPLSVGFGTTFVEGLGELGADGMPTLDEGVMQMDAAHFGRPDYYGSLYAPDGIAREHDRVTTGLAVVKEQPVWFAAKVLDRGTMSFRMERVPVIEPSHDERAETPAPYYFANVPLKLFQRLFITAIVLPLFLVGCVMLLRSGDDRCRLLLLLTVPIYFFTIQPIVHTEYRYLLPAAHMLILVASLPLGWLVGRLVGSKRNSLTVAK